jgi:hypothetical protein
MDDTSKMLTQEEIDSMLSKKVAAKPAPAQKTISSTAPAPAPNAMPNVQKIKVQTVSNNTPDQAGHHEECIAAGEISSLNQRVAELTNKLARIEVMVAKMEGNGNSPASQASATALKSALQQIQNVNSQVEVITEGLRGTAGYNINKVFNCSSCGSVGVVAVKVKCTKCGQENWWGWWPKKK